MVAGEMVEEEEEEEYVKKSWGSSCTLILVRESAQPNAAT
jgi:hypothetical protein